MQTPIPKSKTGEFSRFTKYEIYKIRYEHRARGDSLCASVLHKHSQKQKMMVKKKKIVNKNI